LAGINNAIGRFGIQRVYTSPFEFEPIEIPTPSPAQHLDINIGVTDINKIGQIVATVFSMIDQYSILATALVIALALFVLRWLYKFVMGLPRRTEVVNASAATDYYYDRQMDNLEPDDIEERRTLKRQKSAARRLIR